MLTRSWGSWSTTRMLIDRLPIADCGLRIVKVRVVARMALVCNSAIRNPQSAILSSHQLQYPEPLRILPVSSQPHPTVPTAPDELSRPPLAAGQHLVNDKVETDLAPHVRVVPFRPGHRDGDAVALLGAAPGAPDRRAHAGAIARPQPAHRSPPVPPLGHGG